MKQKVNTKKRSSIKKYIAGIFGFFAALFFFKSDAQAMIFNSTKSKSHTFKIDGETGLEVDAKRNIILGGGIQDESIRTAGAYPIVLSDTNNTELFTQNKTILGGINELQSNMSIQIPKLQIFGYTGKNKEKGIYYTRDQYEELFLGYTPQIYLLKRNKKEDRNGRKESATPCGFHISAYINGGQETIYDGAQPNGITRQVIFPLNIEKRSLNNFNKLVNGIHLLQTETDLRKRFSYSGRDGALRPTGRGSRKDVYQYFKYCIGIKINNTLHMGPASETVKVGFSKRPYGTYAEILSIEII